MAGRKPVPSVLKLIRGNPGKRALRTDEPTPALGATMPEWLTPAAAAQWPLVARQLEDCGILTNIDAQALGLYCEAFAQWRAASDHIQQNGPLEHRRYGMVASPVVAMANVAWNQMRKMLIEFGMTPSSRTRVARAPVANPEKPRSGLASFRKRTH